MKRLICIICCLFIALLSLTSCNIDELEDLFEVDEVKAVSINLVRDTFHSIDGGVQIEYMDEVFSLMKFLVTYSDGSTSEVGYSDVSVSEIDLNITERQTVTVTYGEVSTSFEIYLIPPVVFVESIEITNEGMKYHDTHGNYIVIYPNENGEYILQIEYTVGPENASNTSVIFQYDTEVDYASVDENGLVTFTGRGSLKVEVVAADGNGASDTITIIAK